MEGPEGVADLLRHTLETTRPSRVPHHRGAGGGRRRHRGVGRVRDRGRPRQGPPAAHRRRRLDAADHALRAEGPRGAEGHRPTQGRRARREQGPRDLERAPGAGGPRARLRDPAVGAGRRRRPGRHRAERPAAAAGRADHRHRQAGAARRPVAQPLQVAVPARPGLVRPPALHQVPRQLAGVRPEGQDRRLARVLHQGDGAQLLVEHRGQARVVRREDAGVDRRGRARRPAGRAAAEAPGARHRHVREAEPPAVPGHGRSSAATSTTPPRTPAPTRTPARSASSSARTTPPSTSAARCGRRAPTSPWCSGPRRTSCGPTR